MSALYIDIDGTRGIVQQHVIHKSSNGMNYFLNLGILNETIDQLVAIFSNAGALVVVQKMMTISTMMN